MRRRRARSCKDTAPDEPDKGTRLYPQTKPRGALPVSAGWDLGRNDHTDEDGQEAPRGALLCDALLSAACALRADNPNYAHSDPQNANKRYNGQ